MVVATASAKKEGKEAKELIPFQRDTLRLMEDEGHRFRLYAPEDVAVDELTNDPGRWVTMCDLLRTMDIVEVLDKGRTFWAELLCVSSSITGAKMQLLRSVKLPPPLSDSHGAPDGFRFIPDAELGFIVIRISDGVKFADARAQGWTADERGHEQARRFVLDHATVRQR